MVHLSQRVAKSGAEMLEVIIDHQERYVFFAMFPEQAKSGRPSPFISYHLAQLAYWAGNYNEVLDLTQAIKGDVSLLSAFLQGHALWQLGRQEEAIDVWKPLPNVDRYFHTRALQAENQRDYALLEQYTYQELLLTDDKESAESGYRFAIAMQVIIEPERDTEGFEQTVRQAIQLNLDVEQRLLRMGVALFDQRQLDLAKECLEPTLELENISYWSHFQLGLVYYLLEDYLQARDQFLSALKIDPEFGRANLYLARSFVRMDQGIRAVPYYREAIRLLPEVPGIEFELNQLLGKIGSNG